MNLPLPVAVAVMVLVAVALYLIMWRGWRARVRRTAPLVPELPQRPSEAALGAARTEPVEAVYVSSTTAGDWLDRVAALELGFRSAARVQVFDAGVVIERTGARDVFVPAAAVVDASTAPGMAGKFVGKEGLVVVTWTPSAGAAPGTSPSTTLDTGLRTRHAADRPVLVDAVRSLRAGAASTTEEKK